MSLVSRSPAATRRKRWRALALAAGASALAGLAALRPGASAALWVLFSSAVVAHWAGRRASDCGVLADLPGRCVGDIATPLAVISARSSTPLLDLARIRAAGGGVVMVDDVAKVLVDRRIERLDVDLVLAGRWDAIAVPATQIAPGVAVDHLRRLPDEDEVWLVHTRVGTRMLSGDGLRATGSVVRTVRGHRVARAARTAEPIPQNASEHGDGAGNRPRRGRLPQHR